MSEKYENLFHKRYVGGEGEIVEKAPCLTNTQEYRGQTYEDVLAEYRWYVGDSTAELPEDILEQLALFGKI